MQELNDERLIAYLDGEFDAAERAEIAAALDASAALRDRAADLTATGALLRAAFDPVLHEPLPERLIAAARGDGKVASLAAARSAKIEKQNWRRIFADHRWQSAVAASVVALVVGSGAGYLAGNHDVITGPTGPTATASNLVDNVAVYYNLINGVAHNDVKPSDTQPDIRVPNLKPWGLDYQGARYLAIEGQQATQLFYTTDNQQLGPLTIVVAATSKPDVAPDTDKRGDVNVLHWRHGGHAYAIVGKANFGYLWNLEKDIAFQLDAI